MRDTKVIYQNQLYPEQPTNKKEEPSGVLMLSNFKTYYKAAVIETVWALVQQKTDPWNRIDSPEIMGENFANKVFDKGLDLEYIKSFYNSVIM